MVATCGAKDLAMAKLSYERFQNNFKKINSINTVGLTRLKKPFGSEKRFLTFLRATCTHSSSASL